MNKPSRFSLHLNPWIWAAMIAVILFWGLLQFALKPMIEKEASKMIGARVTIGSCSLNLFTQKFGINDLQIYNPEGFAPKVFFIAPRLLVSINPWDTLQGKLHFPLIVFHLDKMIVFRNAEGKFNVYELKIVQDKLKEKNKGPLPNFRIDELKLNINDVIFEDDGKTPALITAYNVNLKDKTIKDIDGVPKLVGSVLFEALKPTALRGAGVFLANTLLGVGFLPGLALGAVIASNDASEEFGIPVSKVYAQSLALVKRLEGEIKKEDEATGTISAKVYGCDVVIQVQKSGWNASKVIVKARKYLLAKQEIAAGILYQLKEDLKF